MIERDRIADTLRLAERLGGVAATIPGGRRIADDTMTFARANNVTQIVIGKSTRSRWFELLNGSVVHDLVRRSGNISVHVIAGDNLARMRSRKKTVKTTPEPKTSGALGYAGGLAATALALGAAKLMSPISRPRPFPSSF